MTCTLFGMLLTFTVTVFAVGFVAWLGARRLVRHYQGNPEAARSFVDNVLIPLLGEEEGHEEEEEEAAVSDEEPTMAAESDEEPALAMADEREFSTPPPLPADIETAFAEPATLRKKRSLL